MKNNTLEICYKTISEFYGDRKAHRSKVPYIQHIDEGLKILDSITEDEVVKGAYCLHPILQGDDDFRENWKSEILKDIPRDALVLCMEYRHTANSYLSNSSPFNFIGFSCIEVEQMLIADKVQNEKDFAIHHEDTHPRAKELRTYFDNWEKLLGQDFKSYHKFL